MPRMATDSSTDDEVDTELVGHVVNELLDLAEAQRAEQPSSTKRQRKEPQSSTTKRHKALIKREFVETKLLPPIVDLNQALDRIPTSYTRSEAKTIYNELCESSKMLRSATFQSHFKFDNFLKCVGLRFPETSSANIEIRLVSVCMKYLCVSIMEYICLYEIYEI